MTENTEMTSWLDAELKNLEAANKFEGEKIPALKFEEKKITDVTVDISQKWEKWHDEVNQTYKAMIPCTSNGVKHIWWLNIKNPVYSEIVRAARNGVLTFRVLQTGVGKATKYSLIH